jgi:hypothetical protein
MTSMALALTVLAVGESSAAASGDQVVLHDSQISRVYALGNTLVYERVGPGGRPAARKWMRWVGGRKLRARHVPADAAAGAIGRDRHDRVVLPIVVTKVNNHVVRSTSWWIYDVASDRARRLPTFHEGRCALSGVSVWRSRVAYATSCGSPSKDEVFLREGGHTRKVSGGQRIRWMTLRGDVLVAVVDDYGDSSVWRLVAGGKVCRTQISGSSLPEEWAPLGLWLSGRTVVWWIQPDYAGAPDTLGALVGARLRGCASPAPTGAFAIPSLPVRHLDGLTVNGQWSIDGRWLYYADAGELRRHRLDAAPQTDPPSNDDFHHATPLIGDPPISLTQTIGNATTQAGDPTAVTALFAFPPATVWYAFRPTTTQRVRIAGGTGVFEGAEIQSLTPVGTRGDDGALTLNAIAGSTYRIIAACGGSFCYLPFELQITAVGPTIAR